MNASDSERVATILDNMGYDRAKTADLADLIVVVACSVKKAPIDRIMGKGHNWLARRKAGKLVTILTGCVLDDDLEIFEKRFDCILPIGDIGRLPQILQNECELELDSYFHINPNYNSSFQAQVPIMTGCNNFCSYCVVPYVRGKEVSRPAKEIINECKNLIKKGYKEITLLGQNVNSYSDSLVFPELLKEIDKIKGDYWLRFMSSHPKDFSNELIEVMKNGEHTTPHLHLPVQSGDKSILTAMNRKYTPQEYLEIIDQAKKEIPSLMISTDIIVGFPGESRTQFLNTLAMMEEVEYDMAYISQYSQRAKTEAADLVDDVSSSEKKRRDMELTEILKKTALSHNQQFIGQAVRVLVESCKKGKCFGKTRDFRTVEFKGPSDLIGEFVDVKIIDTNSWVMQGEFK